MTNLFVPVNLESINLTTKVVSFCQVLNCLTNRVCPDRAAPIGTIGSGFTLFGAILTLVIGVSKYIQQTTWMGNIS